MNHSAADTGSGNAWIIETVEKGYVGEYTSHLIDTKGKVHIFYFDYIHGNLRHAVKGPDGWTVETVDQEGTVGQYLSITEDGKGIIFISYRDQGKNRLKMAVFDGNKWDFEVVDTEPFSSIDTSIGVDTAGRIYISYHNFHEGTLKLAVKDQGVWRIEVVDDGRKASTTVGGFSSIRLDSRGRVHISYIDSVNGLLKYAVKDGDQWTIEAADDCEFVGSFTSLALDGDGNPYISYTVDKMPNKPDLWLARKAGGKWMNELVDTERVAGNYSSIALDRNSDIYISYSFMKRLKLARNTGGLWNYELVDTKGTITYTSLSLDKEGLPHIAYYDKDMGVKYAHPAKAA